jgi:hypothetical protein
MATENGRSQEVLWVTPVNQHINYTQTFCIHSHDNAFGTVHTHPDYFHTRPYSDHTQRVINASMERLG